MKNKGLTLLETIIAIFILLVGVIGAFAAFGRTISYNSIISSRLVAAYLCQEGIEIVRNIRDTNWINGRTGDNSWQGVDNCLTGTCCQFQYDDFTSSPYSPNDYLKIDDNGFYNYISGTDTKFNRKVCVDINTNSSGEKYLAKVTVTVSWQDEGKNYSITAEENLYEWVQ